MEKRKEKNGPTHLPQFGAWDQNGAADGGYTMEFSKARANKQHQPKTGLDAHHELKNDGKNGYRSVPQFGMWDQQDAGGGAASYTIEFSKARVNRKQHKKNDLLARPPSIDHEQEALRKQHEDSCMRKKNMLTYLNCCIKP
ncbi:hypothetical protein P3L10_031628 [Capsicum annuum]|uniref:uncharacterized protein LOC107849651 n=1 Tax=Capsicum annuum TaxID=4072 RepID=UPI001FB0EC1C|nr:uncharacterized protein LOC107849651 [Capsicum annuum]